MRVLFVSDTYYPHLNGVYYFVCRIAPLLQEKGYEVAVFAPSETMSFTLKKIDNIDVYGIPSLPVLLYPKVRIPIPVRLKSRIADLVKTLKPDLIHIQDHFMISRAVIKVAKSLGIPIIATNHFMPENLTALIASQRLQKIVEKMLWASFSKVLNQIKLITTPTETGARLICPKLNTKVIAISSGIDLHDFNPLGNPEEIRLKYHIPNKPVLLFVGRIDPEKHIEEILHAVAIVTKKIDCCFVVVGKGLRKIALEQLAKDLGISDKVVFTGFVPDEDLPFIYKLSHSFIIASIAELLSLATLQAMASGLPVIAANAGALPELVHHDLNGYLFDPGDIKTLTQCIFDMLTKEDTYSKMCEKSLEIASHHDIRNTVDSFEKLYKKHAAIGEAEKPLLTRIAEKTT
ncbi:MAG: glycosyltransferase [Bacteroidota bacterium]|nr:glycosyltransferase [Bacteroidota bacterium]